MVNIELAHQVETNAQWATHVLKSHWAHLLFTATVAQREVTDNISQYKSDNT